MKKKERYEQAIEWFKTNMPIAETELKYSSPFELLIAVILSAQCTDKRVNMITPRLFADFPTPEALAATTPEVVFDYIHSVSYPNNKSKHLVGMAKMLVSDFNSEVPDNLEELIRLPGVGRKTANVIQSVIFNKAAMAVDTHVFRVSHRIGLVSSRHTTPLSVEKELVKNIPGELLPIAHHWLILHGRYVCRARDPQCDTCGLKELCYDYSKRYKLTADNK
jgi:endonuclease-3